MAGRSTGRQPVVHRPNEFTATKKTIPSFQTLFQKSPSEPRVAIFFWFIPFYAIDVELFDFHLFRFYSGETTEEVSRKRKSKS
jgi:hypothetical protein